MFFGKRESKKVPKNHGSSLAEKMAGLISCPAVYFPEGTDKNAILLYYRYRVIQGKKKGFTPVLVPVSDRLLEYWERRFSEGIPTKELLASASSEKGKKFLSDRFREYEQDYVKEYNEPAENLIGKYSGAALKIGAFMELFAANAKSEEIILFEVPVAHPWGVFAYLPFGGWNECPEQEEVISVCRYWYEKYEAVPSIVSLDTIEMTVPSPIGKESSIDAAKEHYAFCPDRVEQFTKYQTVSELAASLSVSDVWYFWWD